MNARMIAPTSGRNVRNVRNILLAYKAMINKPIKPTTMNSA